MLKKRDYFQFWRFARTFYYKRQLKHNRGYLWKYLKFSKKGGECYSSSVRRRVLCRPRVHVWIGPRSATLSKGRSIVVASASICFRV